MLPRHVYRSILLSNALVLSSSDIESNHPIYLLGIDVPDTPKLAEAWAPVLLNVVENVCP